MDFALIELIWKSITGKHIAWGIIWLNFFVIILFAGFNINWWADIKGKEDFLRVITLVGLHVGSFAFAYIWLDKHK